MLRSKTKQRLRIGSKISFRIRNGTPSSRTWTPDGRQVVSVLVSISFDEYGTFVILSHDNGYLVIFQSNTASKVVINFTSLP